MYSTKAYTDLFFLKKIELCIIEWGETMHPIEIPRK